MSWLSGARRLIARRPIVRFVPERRLALAIAIASPLWLLPGSAGWIVGGGALALVVLTAAWDIVAQPTAGALGVVREIPHAVGIGDSVEGEYVIVSSWPRHLVVELRDSLPAACTGGMGRTTVRLPPHATARVPFAIRGTRRGSWPLGQVGARARTSLGLAGSRFAFFPEDEMRVIPSVTGVKRFRLLAMQHRLDTIGVRALRRRGEGQGFAGLRDYVIGDDPRHIDWKATARKRKAITREYTIERSQTVLIAVDAGRAMTQLAGELSRFEHALSSALVLTDIAADAGDRVGALVFDDEVRAFVPPQMSRGALRAIRDAFVPVTASTREPDYAGAFRFLASHQRKRALIVLFTDVIDAHASKALLAYAAHSAARHMVVIVALRNDSIFEAALPGPGANAAALYERAAAEELILARNEALQNMRRSGAVVLDVSPRVMTSAVINRYLELKSRGAV